MFNKLDKLKKTRYNAMLTGYDLYHYLVSGTYFMMRRYNWLLSEYNPVLKWATEELEKRNPGQKSVFGKTYREMYEDVLKNAADTFLKKDLIKYYEMTDQKVMPLVGIVQDDNWDAVARFDQIEPKSQYAFKDFVKKFKEPSYNAKKIGPNIWGHYAEHEYQKDAGIYLYTLIYLLEHPTELAEFYKYYNFGLKFYSPEETLEEYNEWLKNKDATVHFNERESFLYCFANLLRLTATTKEEKKKIEDLMAYGKSDMANIPYFYELYSDEDKKQNIYAKALEQYWNAAISILVIAPKIVPYNRYAIREKNYDHIVATFDKYHTLSTHYADKENNFYKNLLESFEEICVSKYEKEFKLKSI